MTLARENHPDPQSVDIEFRHMDKTKQDLISFSTRAPHAKDKGKFWVKYTANDDTTITFYIRHPKSGTWRSVNLT